MKAKRMSLAIALFITGLLAIAMPVQADDFVLDVTQMVGNLEGLAAQQEDGFACGVGPGGITFDSHAVLSNSGNETLQCHCTACTLAPPQVIKGVLCGLIYNGLTTNSQLVVSEDGDVNLRCQFKAND